MALPPPLLYQKKQQTKLMLLQFYTLASYISSYAVKPLQGLMNCSAEVVIRLCAQGRLNEAIDTLHSIKKQGLKVTESNVFYALLTSCISKKAFTQGKLVHVLMNDVGFEPETASVSVRNKIVSLYAKCGNMVDARRIFDKMPERNSLSWTVMIAAYSKHGLHSEALNLYCEMLRTGIRADEYILSSIIPACRRLDSLKIVHGGVIRENLQSNVFVGSALLDMYAKCGRIEDARQVFDKISDRNVVSWTAMISGYAHNGNVDEAKRLFGTMPCRDLVTSNMMIAGYWQNGCAKEAVRLFEEMSERNVISWTAMIEGLVQVGNVEEALKLFDKMPVKDVVAWSAMIAGCVQNGFFDEALRIFQEMKQIGTIPNSVTFAGVLPAFANLASLQYGRKVHQDIITRGYQYDVYVSSGLVDMYAKCGSIKDARKVFDMSRERNVVVWNVMIVGYAIHGSCKEAIQLFEQMEAAGTKPDHVAFVAVLSACSHVGLVDEGCQYFACMSQHYGITPETEHYCCMVDLLGRAGRLDDAQNFINKMPIKPDAAVWGSLLGACAIHKNIKLGQHVAERLFQLESKNPANYVLLSNIYAAAGRWNEKENVRKTLDHKNLKKIPGRSWIEINRDVHFFLVGDRSHPQAQEIYAKLVSLGGQMNELGFVADTNFVLHDVEEEQKAHALHYHSETLAVAFGLINTSPGTTIRVVKNLRVCGNCHTVSKFISKMEKREIIVRDANRFHHFIDGECSCGNYW